MHKILLDLFFITPILPFSFLPSKQSLHYQPQLVKLQSQREQQFMLCRCDNVAKLIVGQFGGSGCRQSAVSRLGTVGHGHGQLPGVQHFDNIFTPN